MSRIILHIDMNSYFASVEQQANPFLRGKPIGITGKRQTRTIVATASIEAKHLGIKTAMSTWEAKKICPKIILVPCDFEKYSEITSRFDSVFKEFTSCVETFSIDESFLDISDIAKDFFGAVCIAQAIRERLKETCGKYITASIGIAENKLLAKLASDAVKPNGITVIQNKDAISFLDKSKLEDVCGIGHQTTKHLNNLGIFSFKQLREFPVLELINEFQSYGVWLHNASLGKDDSELNTEIDLPKSIGHSFTLPFDTFDNNITQKYLLGLCDSVASQLRQKKFVTRCVSVVVRHDDFSFKQKQHAFREPLSDGLMLFQIAQRLIEQIINLQKPIRLIGISVSDLSIEKQSSPLFKKEQKIISTLRALDNLQERYGQDIWTRASLLPIKFTNNVSNLNYK